MFDVLRVGNDDVDGFAHIAHIDTNLVMSLEGNWRINDFKGGVCGGNGLSC